MKSGKVIQLSTQLKEVFCYSVGPFRWSIANSCGVMIKTLKCAPMAELEKSATNVQQVPKPYALVIDEMAMVRKVRNKGVLFDKYADELLKFALPSSLCQTYGYCF